MAEFFSFLKVLMICSTVFFVATAVLLALPQSRLRSVGLEMTKWALVFGLFVLTISPADIIPDVLPGLGFADDLCYIIAAICTAKSALQERKRRKALEDIDFEQAVASKHGETSPSDSDDDDQKEAA